MDILVEEKLVLELKCVDEFCDNHKAQVLTYLRLGDYRLGLLINFKESMLKDGIKRIAHRI